MGRAASSRASGVSLTVWSRLPGSVRRGTLGASSGLATETPGFADVSALDGRPGAEGSVTPGLIEPTTRTGGSESMTSPSRSGARKP
jgi:hypothetical protein